MGLVLVNSYTRLAENKGARAIGEFFVSKEHRKKDVGKEAAMQVFSKFPGRWEVAVAKENAPGLKFWENVISAYTKGNFEKVTLDNDIWRGPIYCLSS